ncbi:uncharacterized protein N7525_011627 [Penicillium rubens]|uniref:uncharacterized protein n=1 Tax=Penicillium rubens TaxID=1108849 RepID=UPI002A59EE56|nr:uncharacterized protein N7525_011627 [Penicillium rubens]KAJ5822343.1 hypothetical protein N7525_011627 [Penicillium rubens]
MPARAHRRAPDPLAGAVNPLPPCRGLSPMAPRGSGLALYAPLPKPPGRWPPSTPDPPAVRRTGESVKSPYLPPRRGSSPTPLQSPGSLSPGKVPPPRACTPRLAPRARPPASRAGFASTSPAGAANSPAAPTGAPRPPSQGREAPPAAPRPGAGGGGTAGGARLRGDRRAGGSYREGHPARAPTVTSPAIPAPPTQRDAATLAGPHSLSPGPLGPGRFYTDSPTPFGV